MYGTSGIPCVRNMEQDTSATAQTGPTDLQELCPSFIESLEFPLKRVPEASAVQS